MPTDRLYFRRSLCANGAHFSIRWLVLFFATMMPACDRPPADSGDTATRPAPLARQLDNGIGPDTPARALTPLSEYEGAIARVVVHVPEKHLHRIWIPLSDLIRATTSATQITMVCDTTAASETLQQLIKKEQFANADRLAVRNAERPLLLWSRDRYISCQDAAQTGDSLPVWLVPVALQTIDAERRATERLIPSILNQPDRICRIAESPLALEGGNVLGSSTFTLIGSNVLKENADGFTPDEVKAELARTFKGRVFLVQDNAGKLPINHVDMFISVVGDRQIVLASPRLAADVMATADAASRKALDDRLLITPNMAEPRGPDYTAARAAIFDAINQRIQNAGYHVTCIPYADSRNGDFVVTYNNVLQEMIDGRHVVYMPVYDIPALDDAATRVYQSLGMTVKPIRISPISHLLGAIRCMANVVERR